MTAQSVSGQLPVPQSRVYLKRNCLLRLETSMVSMSITWMSRKPSRAYRQTKRLNTKNKVTTTHRSRRWTQKTRSQVHTDQEDEHRKKARTTLSKTFKHETQSNQRLKPVWGNHLWVQRIVVSKDRCHTIQVNNTGVLFLFVALLEGAKQRSPVRIKRWVPWQVDYSTTLIKHILLLNMLGNILNVLLQFCNVFLVVVMQLISLTAAAIVYLLNTVCHLVWHIYDINIINNDAQ